MKKFFIALTVLLCVTGVHVEAVPLLDSQYSKVFDEVKQHPAAAPESSATLNLNIDTLKERFNGFVEPFIKQVFKRDDISALESIFMIKDCKTFPDAGGDTFANIFGARNPYAAIIGVTVPGGGNFKILQCCYVTPEDKDEIFAAQLILTAFIRSVAPDVTVPTLMNELTAENSSGTVTKGDVKFSIAEDDNLNILTAVKN